MSENFFKKIFANKSEELDSKESEEPKEESLKSQEKINQEIEVESQKLKNNFESLQTDLSEFKSEEELEVALMKNPGIAKRILSRAAQVMIPLMMVNAMFVGSINKEMHSGDIKGLAITLFEIALASGAIAAVVEGLKAGFKKVNKMPNMDLDEPKKMDSSSS